LLFLIDRHTNDEKGFAWASQETLAWEMGVSRSTVQREFRRARRMGIVVSRTIRGGKGKTDQHNEYYLDVERMKHLRRTEQASPMTPASDEQASPMTPQSAKQASPVTMSKRHQRHSAGVTHDAEGLQEAGLQNADSSKPTPSENHKSVFTLRSQTRNVVSPTNGQNNPQLETDRQEFITKTIAAIHALNRKIKNPEYKYESINETRREIKTWRRLAGQYRKSLKAVGYTDMSKLFAD
jgi:biotin operon repressor